MIIENLLLLDIYNQQAIRLLQKAYAGMRKDGHKRLNASDQPPFS